MIMLLHISPVAVLQKEKLTKKDKDFLLELKVTLLGRVKSRKGNVLRLGFLGSKRKFNKNEEEGRGLIKLA